MPTSQTGHTGPSWAARRSWPGRCWLPPPGAAAAGAPVGAGAPARRTAGIDTWQELSPNSLWHSAITFALEAPARPCARCRTTPGTRIPDYPALRPRPGQPGPQRHLSGSGVPGVANVRGCWVSANDRLRNTGRVTYFRDIGLRGLPLPLCEHGRAQQARRSPARAGTWPLMATRRRG